MDAEAILPTVGIEAKYYRGQKIYTTSYRYIVVLAVCLPKVWWKRRQARYLVQQVAGYRGCRWKSWVREDTLDRLALEFARKRNARWSCPYLSSNLEMFLERDETPESFLDDYYEYLVDTAYCGSR